MKKKIISILLVTVLFVVSSGSVAFAKSADYKIHNGEKLSLTVYGGYGAVKWSSSNKKIAKVSKSGVVTGLKAGTCTITAKRSGAKAKCKVKVYSYYSGWKYIPDFGATNGVVAKKTGDYYYLDYAIYKAKNVKTAKKWISTYQKTIKKKGFKRNHLVDEEDKGSWIDAIYGLSIKRKGKYVCVVYGNSDDIFGDYTYSDFDVWYEELFEMAGI